MTVRVQRNFYHLRSISARRSTSTSMHPRSSACRRGRTVNASAASNSRSPAGRCEFEYDDEAKWRAVLVEMEKHL
jgi:hypothetical protein